MIVYIATYPRSGNSLLQHMIRRNFRHLTSQIKTGIKSPEAGLRLMRRQDAKIELVPAAAPVSDWPEAVLWHESLAAYRFPGGPWRRMLLPGPSELLTEELREALAGEKNVFFLKTHNLPFDRYFEGEFVLQLVRHPGAVLWSYFRHQHDFVVPKRKGRLFASPPPTLENVIGGRMRFGSWSHYQKLWREAGKRLGSRFLSFPFEALVADQLAALERVSEWLRLPLVTRDAVNFQAFKARFPGKDLRGTSEGYEHYYSARQLDLLWEMHGAVAAEYGYAPPDTTIACPDEQVRRLDALLAVAWERHNIERDPQRSRAAALAPGRSAETAAQPLFDGPASTQSSG